MTGAVPTTDPHPQFIAMLVETYADDTLRFTGKTRNGTPLSGRLVRCRGVWHRTSLGMRIRTLRFPRRRLRRSRYRFR
jgi:hypothetical protein